MCPSKKKSEGPWKLKDQPVILHSAFRLGILVLLQLLNVRCHAERTNKASTSEDDFTDSIGRPEMTRNEGTKHSSPPSSSGLVAKADDRESKTREESRIKAIEESEKEK